MDFPAVFKNYFQKIVFILILLLSLFFFLIPIIRSGLVYDFGIGFWGPNGHDYVWHLSLINHIENIIDIPFPTFSGTNLTNYHPFFNILLSTVSKITKLSPSTLLFQIAPIFLTIIYFYSSYLVSSEFNHGSKYAGLLSIVVNTFASSLGFIPYLIRHHTLGGESLFWSMQSASTILNPPYFLSLIFINFLIYSLLKIIQKTNNDYHYFIVSLVLIILPITKVYSLIPAFIITYLISLYLAYKRRPKILIVSLISTVVSYFVFRIYNPSSSNLLIFSPFWFSSSLIESFDRLYIPYLAKLKYLSFPKDFIFYFLSISLFYLGNFGLRLVGALKINKKSFLDITLILAIIVSALIPLFFIQASTAWNTIQFLYYSLFLSNLFLIRYLSQSKLIVTPLFIILFIASNYDIYRWSLGNPPPSMIPNSEIQALEYLNSLPPGVVLAPNYNQYYKLKIPNTPIPLYAYETTSYISAYTHHLTFLADEMNVANSNLPLKVRQNIVNTFFTTQDPITNRGILLNNSIDYIYLTGLQRQDFELDTTNLYIKKIYSNDSTDIYQVLK